MSNLEVITMKNKLKLNPATGMAMGAIVAALISIIVHLATKDSSVWLWSIPIGIAVGLPIGIAAKKKKKF
jgi:hypothetical protein